MQTNKLERPIKDERGQREREEEGKRAVIFRSRPCQ